MKTDDELRGYLDEAKGDLKEARRIACERHHFMDQTLDMKFTTMEAMNAQGD